MYTSIRDFNAQLYAEHAEEGAFLYAQRLALMADDSQPWTVLHAFESRLEAHIDALVIGQGLALKQCLTQLDPADAGTLFVVVSVVCRLRRSDLLATVLKQVDFGDAGQQQALSLALKWALPAEWHGFVERAIQGGDVKLVGVLADVVGYRRLPMSGALIHALSRGFSSQVLLALGKLRANEASGLLTACLSHPDSAMRASALQALLCMGVGSALTPQYLAVQVDKWPRMALALGGSKRATTVFLDIVRAGKATPECLLALGLLGDLSAMRTLYECLSIEACAGAAALGLNWITGANLYEEAFVAEAVQEDELFEGELLAWRQQHKAPTRLDGQPFGQKVRRLSTDPRAWGQWWSDNQQRFDASLRYRSGQAYGPQALWSNLMDEQADRRLRRLAALELQIRYRCTQAFETDMPVRQQLSALQAMGEWLETAAASYQPGAWYLDGQPQ